MFDLWPKVVSEKQKQVAALVQTAKFVHPKEKNLAILAHTRYLTKLDDQEKQLNISDKIAAQLETICQTFTRVESRLQKLENTFEPVSGLEKSVRNSGTELETTVA